MGSVTGSVMLCHLKLVYQQYQRTNNTDKRINDTDQLTNELINSPTSELTEYCGGMLE